MDSPPGLEEHGKLELYSSGGDGALWAPLRTRKLYTNAYIIKDGKVLLGLKKRGFGLHKWNGFGGKVDPGETSAEAAVRELKEEAGIDAPLEHCGTFLFVSESTEKDFHIDIYRATTYSGEVKETEEMLPRWFALEPQPNDPENSIPFGEMWESDLHWWPLVVAGKKFVGRTDFAGPGDGALRRWWFGTYVEEQC